MNRRTLITAISIGLSFFGGVAFIAPAVLLIERRLEGKNLSIKIAVVVFMLSAAIATVGRGDPRIPIQWGGIILLCWFSSGTKLDHILFRLYGIISAAALFQVALSLPQIVRASSILWNSNNLGTAMLPALALATHHRRWHWFILYATVLILTGSRSALIGCLAGVAIYLVIHASRFLPALLILGAMAVLISVNLPGHGSMALRVDLWRVGLLAWRDHPLIGIGAGNYTQAFEAYAQLTHEQVHFHAHNVFIHIAAETGWVGLLVLVLLLIAIVTQIYRTRKVVLAALFTAVLVAGMMDYVYWHPGNLLLLCLPGMTIQRSIGEAVRQGGDASPLDGSTDRCGRSMLPSAIPSADLS